MDYKGKNINLPILLNCIKHKKSAKKNLKIGFNANSCILEIFRKLNINCLIINELKNKQLLVTNLLILYQ